MKKDKEVKLCVDCAHYHRRDSTVGECKHPEALGGTDPVDGHHIPAWCSVERISRRCGPEGKRFEPRREAA